MDDSSEIIGWAAVLIAIFILVTYYRGTASMIQIFTKYSNRTITFLQGR